MSIFFPPPPPFVGGAQPYAPAVHVRSEAGQIVDNPPFTYGGPIAPIAEIIQQAQPSLWPYVFMGQSQPYEGLQLPAFIISVEVDNPPFTYGGPIAPTAEIIQQTQPDIWPFIFIGALQPYAPLNPAYQLGMPANNPPFIYGGPFANKAEAVALAQPDPWTYNYPGSRQPYSPKQLNPAITAVPANNPPFGRRPFEQNAELVNANQPMVWPYIFFGACQPYAPFTTATLPASGPAPPLNNQANMNIIISAWSASYVAPQIYKQTVFARLAVNHGYIIG